jgi:cytochrome c oxidase subunit 2
VRRLIGAAGLLALAGCNRVQTMLDPAGDEAAGIHGVWTLMLWVCGFMYLLVIGFLVWAMLRRRAARLGVDNPEPTAADAGLEKVLAGWVGLILVGLTVLVGATFLVDRAVAGGAPPGSQRIKITAEQFWWRVEYQDADPSRSFETANELHLPVGKPVWIELTSNDVIHSFWVPNLHGKKDLIPGRTNTIRLTPRKMGDFRGQCAEFCGLQHAHMAFDVRVDSVGDFQRWKDRQVTPAPEPLDPWQQRGRAVFLGAACVMCHRIAGTEAGGRVGPDLTHVASRKTLAAGTVPYSRGALSAWIDDPQGIKPGAHMPVTGLTPEDRDALVAYLDTLR